MIEGFPASNPACQSEFMFDFHLACRQASLKSVLHAGFHAGFHSIARGNFSLAPLREDVC
jgi:hypothetical protein